MTADIKTKSAQVRFGIGDAPPRVEDDRLLRGNGRYLDDLYWNSADGVPAVMYVLRSPHAHARVRGIDVSVARSMRGVHCVLTGSELNTANLAPLPPHARVNPHTGEAFSFAPQPLLALDRVRYVGEPVVVVVGEDLEYAQEAAEYVIIDYEPYPAVNSARAALCADAPILSDEVPGNLCLDWCFGDTSAVEKAFGDAQHIVSIDLHNHRIVQNPMEPRGAIGRFDAEKNTFELRASTQNVHVIAQYLALCLGVPSTSVRLIAPDVGGGFGTRNFAYTEYVLVLWAARVLGRPVKWINSRSDGFISDHQARDMDAQAELALDSEGRFLGYRVHACFNVGAYMTGVACGVPTGQYVTLPSGVYNIPCVQLQIKAALSNTVPVGVSRGPGFAEAVDVLERLVDKAARYINIDRMQLRRINLVSQKQMPWQSPAGVWIDSGDFNACLERGLAYADVQGFETRRTHAQAAGQRLGLGLAMHIKATGGNPEENIHIGFEEDRVVLVTGTQAIGQGHETSFRQIVSGLLGVPFEQIDYRAGDTALIAMGGGHGSSRATYMAGTAMSMAAERIIAKGRELAAHRLEVALVDVAFEHGRFYVPGTDRGIGLLEIAAQARSANTPLDTYQHFTRESMTFPNGCHVAEVLIDTETGQVRLQRYHAVDDYGVLINPVIAAGQMHGAIAQGVGQALLERAFYDPGNAQPITASFMDYAMPRADDLPDFEVCFEGERCVTNPLGVKGCGESGAIAGFPAVNNAIADALADLGVSNFDGPASPYHIWCLLHGHIPDR